MLVLSMLGARKTMLDKAKTTALFKIEYHRRLITIFFFPLNNTRAEGTITLGKIQKTTT
jgi:hypothetical protein